VLPAEEEKPFKEILYLLVEKVKATKAAFYLVEPNGSFQLVTQYGFNRADRLADRLQRTDAIAIDIYEHREPHFYNDYRSAGRLAAMMEATSTARILVAPLYLDRRIVGLLDVRDKAGREPFTNEDLSWITDILRRFALKVKAIPRFAAPVVAEMDPDPVDAASIQRGTSQFAPAPTFSGRAEGTMDFEPSPLVDTGGSGLVRAAPGLPAPSPEPLATATYLPTGTARAQKLVQDTLGGTAGARPAAGPPPSLSREAGFYKLYLSTCLHLPDVEAAAITTVTSREGAVLVSARRPLAPDFAPALFENLEKVFIRSGATFAMPTARRVENGDVLSASAAPFARAEIAAIQSSVLATEPDGVSILSLVFRHGPGAEAREGLKDVHLLVKNSLAEIRSSSRYRDAYRILVNKLVEPGLKKYTALKAHSFNVGRLARKFATALGAGAVEVEQITVAAILHDVGMRELNYDEIYGKRTLTEEEVALVREHPRVGAFLCEEIPFPYPVVPLIRHHHERWDGAGYPDGLKTEQIPLGARIIHLCEAFDAMTSRSSYRAVLSTSQALEIIVSKAGTQFDPELAPAFKRLIDGARAS